MIFHTRQLYPGGRYAPQDVVVLHGPRERDLHPQLQPQLREDLLELCQELRAELLRREELGFRHLDELSEVADTEFLQSVLEAPGHLHLGDLVVQDLRTLLLWSLTQASDFLREQCIFPHQPIQFRATKRFVREDISTEPHLHRPNPTPALPLHLWDSSTGNMELSSDLPIIVHRPIEAEEHLQELPLPEGKPIEGYLASTNERSSVELHDLIELLERRTLEHESREIPLQFLQGWHDDLATVDEPTVVLPALTESVIDESEQLIVMRKERLIQNHAYKAVVLLRNTPGDSPVINAGIQRPDHMLMHMLDLRWRQQLKRHVLVATHGTSMVLGMGSH
ncbi:MAG: hypothetical protein UV82_C0006G0009 [Candidatus Magasanikbacteria bacterium GW2011_GWD2_43_18]|nr:MAG: hypothetical protein UV18_C0005G0079 [Candidatus Magasanikbacteria bacterium GW2011_GWC2_42_27]KKT04653.1 MAG: hypothetical protein UV82_C0006G0009 [Candidatus Magasanikbacteria bacterium GW2011_GWD2_43_18]KKT24409.1 MAG: hypothetical protein UW10_C0027G0009 [Candidatus Magasanikbacteria bacterium GW2011_GWA2_43_9]